MRFTISAAALIAATFSHPVFAGKGSANVRACVAMVNDPVKPFEVVFTPGGADTRCMSLVGGVSRVTVNSRNLTCDLLGTVKVKDDDDDGCYWRTSKWSMSYKGGDYSGSVKTAWSTGPFNSDVTIESSSPGTNVCGSDALCSQDMVQWDNNNADARVYVIFRPGTIADKKSEL